MTAAVVGCLAIGGGAATSCIENGVDPIGGIAAIVEEEQAETAPDEGSRPAEAVTQPPPIAPPTALSPRDGIRFEIV